MSIYRNWHNPFWFRNNLIRKVIIPFLFSRNTGNYILKEKWDNLIILDACRYDTFVKLLNEEHLKGNLESRVSRGTETSVFLSENFQSFGLVKDLVYVTANPTVNKFLNGKIFKILPLWKEEWNHEHQTVLPERVYERTIEAMQQYPDKKFVIHFLQPHRPFIGYSRWNWWKNKIPSYRFVRVWGSMAEQGKSLLFSVSDETLIRLYERNLKLVLPYVRRLLEELPGTTVVSADHGEAFGERIHPLVPISVYGHPGRERIRALTKVPWLVSESTKKKIIRAEEPAATVELPREDEDLITERLSALGYV